jgi:uncharacterized protein
MPRNLTETESQQFLAGKHIAVVSVAATDGRPPASVPLWYAYTPGGILIITGASQRKARLIEQAGAVTVVVQREDLPYRHVVVEDTAKPVPVDVRESIATRYLGEEAGRAFVAALNDGQNVLLTIRPDRWFSPEISGD